MNPNLPSDTTSPPLVGAGDAGVVANQGDFAAAPVDPDLWKFLAASLCASLAAVAIFEWITATGFVR